MNEEQLSQIGSRKEFHEAIRTAWPGRRCRRERDLLRRSPISRTGR